MSERVRARLFGLDLNAGFPIVGVEHEPGTAADPIVLELVPRAAVLAGWTPAQRVSDQHDPAGRSVQRIELDRDGNALMVARGWGVYRVMRHRIDCAPVMSAAWRWQRYLIGQVLPLAAALLGIEPMHAAAVAHEGGAIAIVGRSLAGKSTLAAAWVAAGAPLVADDVVALERRGGNELIVHPGPGMLSLRHGSATWLGGPTVARIGRRVGRDEEAERLVVRRHPDPLPLRALLFVDRSEHGGVLVERDRAPDPRLLLGATFNLILQTPERLVRLLDLCAAIAATVPIYRVTLGAAAGPADALATIEGALVTAV